MKADTYREHLNDLQLEVEELRAKLAEQPEIIRCKDCVWWKDEDCTNPVGMFLSEEDDFCSCATRRKENG